MHLTPHLMFTCLAVASSGAKDSHPGAVMTSVILCPQVLIHFFTGDQELWPLEVRAAQMLLVVAAGLCGEQVMWGSLPWKPLTGWLLAHHLFLDSGSPPCSL